MNKFYCKYLKENSTAIGHRITPHALRHTHVSLLAASGLSLEEIVLAMEACTEVESLSKPVLHRDGSEGVLAERIGGGENETEQIVNHLVMKQLLTELCEEDRRLIMLRYFENKTQSEIAAMFGISQVQVSRQEKKILGKMRSRIAE